MSREQNNSTQILIIGRNNIQRALGISSATLSRWKSKHGLPLFRTPGGNVALSVPNFSEWCGTRLAMQQATGLDRSHSDLDYRAKFRRLMAANGPGRPRKDGGPKAHRQGSPAARQPGRQVAPPPPDPPQPVRTCNDEPESGADATEAPENQGGRADGGPRYSRKTEENQ